MLPLDYPSGIVVLPILPKCNSKCKFYSLNQGQKDFEADEAGLVPRDLPREVLSEDALYNLLAEADEMLASVEE